MVSLNQHLAAVKGRIGQSQYTWGRDLSKNSNHHQEEVDFKTLPTNTELTWRVFLGLYSNPRSGRWDRERFALFKFTLLDYHTYHTLPNHFSPRSPCSPHSLHPRWPCYIILYPINTLAPCIPGARFEICSTVFSLAALWTSTVFSANLGCLDRKSVV